MYRHLPKGGKRRVLPRRSKVNLPFIKAGRVLRNNPYMTQQQFHRALVKELGSKPKWQISTMMYEDYRSYHY